MRTNAVAALDLVLVGDLLAGQLARDGLEPAELRAQPAAALLVEPAVVERARSAAASATRPDGSRSSSASTRSDDLRRAVVGVDEPVDVPAEAQAELESTT